MHNYSLLQRTIYGTIRRNSFERSELMSKNNNQAWKTKYGPRRVREEAPTLEEAIVAAQGLSDELDEQVEIAASLMGMPRDQVRVELLKVAPLRKEPVQSVVFAGPASAPRTIVVERKPSRRVVSADRLSRPASSASVSLRDGKLRLGA
jgi:hypothetical protein